ncbi:MAG TPA: hypothetical protein VFA98_13065 [Thermoanaerobaculia bacterium]|jgi:hypothetical protein|nr:hypothetical protein [Thermoanaerobaculia bacterium]
MPASNGKTEDLKTVPVDVQAVLEEVRKKGLLTPDAAPAPKPAAPPTTIVTGGRILG